MYYAKNAFNLLTTVRNAILVKCCPVRFLLIIITRLGEFQYVYLFVAECESDNNIH